VVVGGELGRCLAKADPFICGVVRRDDPEGGTKPKLGRDRRVGETHSQCWLINGYIT
jgi:hypothetical protein